jgi:hypothetical protein
MATVMDFTKIRPNRPDGPARAGFSRWRSVSAVLARLRGRLQADADNTDWMRPRCCRAGHPAGRL